MHKKRAFSYLNALKLMTNEELSDAQAGKGVHAASGHLTFSFTLSRSNYNRNSYSHNCKRCWRV